MGQQASRRMRGVDRRPVELLEERARSGCHWQPTRMRRSLVQCLDLRLLFSRTSIAMVLLHSDHEPLS
jgi:hypothetical protein